MQSTGHRKLDSRQPVVCLSLVLLLLAACGEEPDAKPLVTGPVEGDDIELVGTNWDGERFRLSEHRGDVVIVSFGYTYCPDVCPLTLAKMSRLVESLGDDGDDLTVVFASVDPDRDTVEKLAGYVPNFGRDFFGLRLEGEDMRLAEEAFGLVVQYSQPKDGPGTDSFYYVDHTGTYFVLDRAGRLHSKLPPNASVEQMMTEIAPLLEEAA